MLGYYYFCHKIPIFLKSNGIENWGYSLVRKSGNIISTSDKQDKMSLHVVEGGFISEKKTQNDAKSVRTF